MKKLITTAIAALFVVGVVSAQHPHINKKDQSSVVATADAVAVCFSGVVAGNGNSSTVTCWLEAVVEANSYCFNPAMGAKEDIGVPGHIEIIGTVGAPKTFDCKNGKAYLTDVCAPLDLTPEDCPNDKWTGVVDVTVISAVLYINGKTLDVTSYY